MDYQTLTITELQEIQTLIAVELDRRATIEQIPAQIEALTQRYLDAGGGDKELAASITIGVEAQKARIADDARAAALLEEVETRPKADLA